jgi:hypothetical protein
MLHACLAHPLLAWHTQHHECGLRHPVHPYMLQASAGCSRQCSTWPASSPWTLGSRCRCWRRTTPCACGSMSRRQTTCTSTSRTPPSRPGTSRCWRTPRAARRGAGLAKRVVVVGGRLVVVLGADGRCGVLWLVYLGGQRLRLPTLAYLPRPVSAPAPDPDPAPSHPPSAHIHPHPARPSTAACARRRTTARSRAPSPAACARTARRTCWTSAPAPACYPLWRRVRVPQAWWRATSTSRSVTSPARCAALGFRWSCAVHCVLLRTPLTALFLHVYFLQALCPALLCPALTPLPCPDHPDLPCQRLRPHPLLPPPPAPPLTSPGGRRIGAVTARVGGAPRRWAAAARQRGPPIGRQHRRGRHV